MKRYAEAAETITMFSRLNNSMKRSLPIRASEMGLLIYIVKNEFDVTPLMAAKFFSVSKPLITTMVNALVKNNLIKKERSLVDKRSIILIPLPEAIKFVDSAYVEYIKVIKLLDEKMGHNDFIAMIKLLDSANTILKGMKLNE